MNGIAPSRRTIRLFPDYGRDWPLWENSTPTWDVGHTTTPETYGLSEALTHDLADRKVGRVLVRSTCLAA